jgi:hypothetical protein
VIAVQRERLAQRQSNDGVRACAVAREDPLSVVAGTLPIARPLKMDHVPTTSRILGSCGGAVSLSSAPSVTEPLHARPYLS